MQLALFEGRNAQTVDRSFRSLKRCPLEDAAWVEYAPQWLSGHEDVFEALVRTVAWRRTKQQLYDQIVETPRRIASFPQDGEPPAVVATMAEVLSDRYQVRFDRISAAFYRDGQDSVAWHRDREYRDRPRAVVAIVSVGAPRRFLLRPYLQRSNRPSAARESGPHPLRRSLAYRLGWGDLLVMGGAAQRCWEHAVPKVPSADPRVSIMFRHDPDAPMVDASKPSFGPRDAGRFDAVVSAHLFGGFVDVVPRGAGR